MLKVIKKYESFNARRYGNPWVAKVNSDGKIDFSVKVGGYTGAYGKGEEGELFVNDPIDGQVYAYGQKDYRGNNGGYEYVVFVNGQFNPIDKRELSKYINKGE